MSILLHYTTVVVHFPRHLQLHKFKLSFLTLESSTQFVIYFLHRTACIQGIWYMHTQPGWECCADSPLLADTASADGYCIHLARYPSDSFCLSIYCDLIFYLSEDISMLQKCQQEYKFLQYCQYVLRFYLNILVSILFSRTISAKETASVFLHGITMNNSLRGCWPLHLR